MADLSQLAGLPPQATGATPPGQAQAAGQMTNAVAPIDPIAALQDANFGDGASQKIARLQAATPPPTGQPPVSPDATQSAAGTVGMSVAPPGDAEEAPLSNLAGGGQGDPRILQQNIAMMRLNFLKSMRDQKIPISTQTKAIMDQGQQMGRNISPALAELVARMFSGRNLEMAEQRVKSGDIDFLEKMAGDLPDANSYLALGNDMKQYEDSVAHANALASVPANPLASMAGSPPLAPPPSSASNGALPALQEGGTVDEGGGAVVGESGPEHIQDTPGAGVQVTPLSKIAAPAGLESLSGMNVKVPAYDPVQRLVTTFTSGDPTKYQKGLAVQQKAALELIEQQQKIGTTVRDNFKGLYDDAKFIHDNYTRDQWLPLVKQRAAQRGIHADPTLVMATAENAANDSFLSQHLDSYINGGPLPALSGLATNWQENSKFYESAAKAKGAIEKPGEEAQKTAVDIAAKLRSAQRPPTQDEIQTLDKAGLEAYQVPIPGAPSGTMWSTRPRSSGATGTVSAAGLRQAKTEQVAAGALAKEQATTTAATRTMQETAPKVRALANEVEAALGKIEAGPFASRYQDFMAGKVGAPNPDFIAYKDNAELLSTLLMRMHVGARGGEKFMDKFENMIGAGKQSPENMKSALRVIRRYADITEKAKPGDEIGIPEDAARSGAPTRVQTPADAAALAPGTRFVTPDGQIRVRK